MHRSLLLSSKCEGPCDVLGVSFGGIVAQELAPLIGADFCFVVSSIKSRGELGLGGRMLSKLPPTIRGSLFTAVGTAAQRWPYRTTAAAARARNLSGESEDWYRWATDSVLDWQSQPPPEDFDVVRIHGDRDRTFPNGDQFADHVVRGAGHLLAVTHSEELARIVEESRTCKTRRSTTNPNALVGRKLD